MTEEGTGRMKSKRKMLLLGSLGTAALVAIVKMLVTDLWPEYLRPFVSTAWTWTLEVLTWFAQPVQMPLWLIVVVLLAAVGVIAFFIMIARELTADLNSARAKLNPSLPVLNENAQKVLAVIVDRIDRNVELYASEIPEAAALSRLVCAGAVDVLLRGRLIEIVYHGWGNKVVLTDSGLAYVLHPKSPFAVVG